MMPNLRAGHARPEAIASWPDGTFPQMIVDLTRLGEMRWRYRVAEEGESPREEGLRILEQARVS